MVALAPGDFFCKRKGLKFHRNAPRLSQGADQLSSSVFILRSTLPNVTDHARRPWRPQSLAPHTEGFAHKKSVSM